MDVTDPHCFAPGLRRMTMLMFETQKAADAFNGLDGIGHRKVLAAFKAAAPFLGVGPDVVFTIDWLFKFTQPQDWEPGNRPIVWPSAAEQQAVMGRSATQVKYLNRQLAELGLIVMRDSPNGRRFGRRTNGKTGPIIEAYGFDLSPLAVCMTRFQKIAAEGLARKERMTVLRRRATVARKCLRQILDAAAAEPALGFDPVGWDQRAAAAKQGLADISDETELTLAVVRLEQLCDETRSALLRCSPCPVGTDPKGPENRPLNTTTNELFNPSDTVMAQGRESRGFGKSDDQAEAKSSGRRSRIETSAPRSFDKAVQSKNPGSDAAMPNMAPAELIALAPKLAPYLTCTPKAWSEIVDAAGWLKSELGISASLWGDACVTLGRENAAIAVAVVSTKPDGHFRSSPGAYFFGMVERAKTDQLNLARTIWGLRAARAARSQSVL